VQQLTGMDAGFLSMETATQFGHVASIVVVDPGGSNDVYADLRLAFEQRLHLLGVYRRKLAEVPLGLDHPYWVDDPDLDLQFHLREIGLPRPGDDRQLAEQVARIMARPLDRSRPLWEWYVISGLENGRVAILTKIHHATIDGVSGVELLQILLDTEPDAAVIEPPPRWREPVPPPTASELLGRTLVAYAIRPRKFLELQLRMLRTAAALSGNPAFRQAVAATIPGLRRLGLLERRTAEELLTLPNRSAPRTPFNRAITAHRRFAFRTLRLSDAQAVKRAFGVTVNDVVMAVCSSALRHYLAERDALPEEPLVAMVPVSVRSGGDGEAGTNRVSGVLCSLHTNLGDPVERLKAIHRSMASAKELQEAIPADLLTDVTQFAPPALAARAARLTSSARIADRLNPPFNVTISNVPGPRQPLYLSGARMTNFYPVSVVAEGQGLNMTVQSYLDNLDFGLISCRELVPDLRDLCDQLPVAMDELLEAMVET
jgi:diacylglycerol O-acyltransferase